ncbi:phage tail protein [Pseudomonas stutzeri]|uniref:phage tail protein n=1 Tax=Stutzerimonas stutzeri TaxID=316 RepID=UPI001E42C180|nr:phage tail protein [Stutzerimonas stutzeri]MCC8342819.1 phage tail protein [Stutzerimonas stutzeri]
METHFYSESTGSLLLGSMRSAYESAGTWPADAEAITQTQYDLLQAGRRDGFVIARNELGELVLVERAKPAPKVEALCSRIDLAADAARSRVAGDPLRAVEYDRARIEAQAFADVGYPGDAVPRTVAAWAINGRTAQQAADSILAEAAAYTEALYVIRETRLAAKEQIRMLMDAGEVEQAQQLAEQTIASIEAAVAGVGNAAA